MKVGWWVVTSGDSHCWAVLSTPDLLQVLKYVFYTCLPVPGQPAVPAHPQQ